MKNITSFKKANLSEDIQETLEKLGFKEATEIQSVAITPILEGRDVVAKSKTGSGKTLAFGIPICNNVTWEGRYPQALILEPTRELAEQVREELFLVGRMKRLKIPALFGGFPIHKQIQTLRQKTHIVVGTPGRTLDHIRRETLILDEIKYVVIDEADLMLDMGFMEDVSKILSSIPGRIQLLLFSATLEDKIMSLTEAYMENPLYIQLDSEEMIPESITQMLYTSSREEKFNNFKKLLMLHNPEICIVFCATKEMVAVLQQMLKRECIYAMVLHGNQDQRERLEAIKQFTQGKSRILIATDLASRGIDFSRITHVFNYDFPTGKETYVHRIGRTGRNEKSGHAISIVTEDDLRMLRMVEEYTEQEFQVVDIPEITHEQESQFRMKQKIPLKIKKDREKVLKKDITKLAIGGGRKSKIRTIDIVGSICNIETITNDDIGIIDIRDSITYVEILNSKGNIVMDALQTKAIKGKVRKVSKRK
ncbi:MAG: DEAD/DEAH box helicase [Eubacteriales bacterium]